MPNAAHRDRCVEMTATVESRLGEHFGTPVRLVLEVDDDAPPASRARQRGERRRRERRREWRAVRAPARRARRPPPVRATAAVPGDYEPEDDYDPSAFAAPAPDPGDQAKEAEARLLQAFPGASEVAG